MVSIGLLLFFLNREGSVQGMFGHFANKQNLYGNIKTLRWICNIC